jgi:hypothetical protein
MFFYDLFQRKAGGTRYVPTRNGSKIIVFTGYKKKFLATYFTSSDLQPLQFTAPFFT